MYACLSVARIRTRSRSACRLPDVFTHTHTHTHPFNGPFSGTTWVSRYQKGKTNLDFTEATDSEWQWHQLGHMQVCTSLQTDNHMPARFLQAVCPSCRPTNSVRALKVLLDVFIWHEAILLGSRQRAHSYSSLATVNVAGSQIHLADRIKIPTSSSRLTVMTRDERQR